MEIMDEVEFQDWPGGPSPESVEINSGNNPWMPAYGFQTPSALLEKEDFIGNPDAEYFLSAPATQQYMYLETIQEETSDDMRSDSDDVDEFRNSPMGWLATDSEDGSVICIEQIEDSESDREIACPPKRRKQDFVLNLPDAYFDENSSLSRSSSLLQFETLEKECQQESLSPSVFSQFTFDALQISDESEEFGVNDYSTKGTIFSDFAREIERSKQSASRDSLLYNVSTRYSSSSDSSSDSDTTVENFRSCDNLKTWRSFDNLLLSNGNSKKFSSENLSEDSGYGDQIFNCGKSVNLSNSVGNLASNKLNHRKKMSSRISETNNNNYSLKEKKNSYVGFNAYDCDVFQNFNSNFGVSYQDLSIFNRYDPFSEPPSKIADETFLRKKQILQLLRSPSRNSTGQSNYLSTNLNNVNLDCESISYSKSSKISDCCTVSHAVSAPNLHHSTEKSSVDIQNSTLNVSSVPKDLNFLGGEFLHSSPYSTTIVTSSVAEKNLNLADLDFKLSVIVGNNHQDSSASPSLKLKLHLVEDNKEDAKSLVEPNNNSKIMANYKREGSYSEAMSNRVDLSDDENSLRYKKKLPKSPIVDFDRRVLKAISEQSLQSLTLTQSTTSLHEAQNYHLSKSITTFEPPNIDFTSSTPKNTKNKTVAQSTPNLNRIEPVVKREKDLYFDEARRKSTLEIASCSKYDTDKIEEERGKNILLDCSTDECEGEVIVMRKGSIIKSSTSTSGMSDIDDKTLRHSVKSFSGSNGSKGVHFSPVVAEVNWRDDASTSTVTPDRDSLYSLNSSSPEPENRKSSKMKVIKPKAQYPVHTQARRSVSHPDISDTDSKNYKKEFVESLNNLRGQNQDMSKSQPDVSKLKRRGSQMIKIDPDGSTVKAYVDIDGVQYKHTHLDVNSLSQTSLNGSNPAINSKSNNMMGIPSFASRNSNTSKFPYYEVASSHGGLGDVVEENVQQLSEANKQFKNVEAMNDPRTTTINNKSAVFPKQRKNKSGLGGFLQRLASFRLGAKKGHEKLKRKVETGNDTSINKGQATNLNFISTEKPSYIYIPLKGPSSTTTSAAAGLDNNNIDGSTVVVSSGKPPLPKQPPPRVVHASVKKAAHAPQNGGGLLDERRRRRTIDSANGAVDIIRNSGLYGNGKVSMDGPMGLIETDLDTEVTVITNGSNAKARSLLNLGHHDEPRLRVPENSDGSQNSAGRPHKSMEFLLDKQNLKVVEPPENELQKTERVMSEHELRVQRSLQKLTVPEWYKNSQIPGQGFILKNKNNQQQRETRWKGTTGAGTSSKTTSLSSLGGAQSPLLVLSPTPTSSSQSFVRWSTSKLNSTASSPCQSTRSSFNQGRVQQQPINGSISPSSARSSFNYRQPYLGWRSQERLSRPRTPAERLASSILSKQQNSSPASSSSSTHHNLQQQQESPEIQTSIKEVTSAIVHYVSALRPTDGLDNYQDNLSQRSSSVSPRGSQKLCWLESSFVGTKQLDSPETPVTCSESPVPPTAASSQTLRLDLQNHHHSSNNDLVTLSTIGGRVRPSPSSTTLEDVLDSLLGLPTSGRSASPCLQGRRHVLNFHFPETVSANNSPQRRSSDADLIGVYRRRSEGSEPTTVIAVVGGNSTLHHQQNPAVLLRCRYSRCGKTAAPASKEAKSFKNCHNCTYTYCSRTCRRSHWERHRKTCLFSRMGTLCREVIQAVRDQKDTLKELSKVARRGYISHGLGAVKCFYPNPEAAEKFLAKGLPGLGEVTFIRWQDLLPTEMGPMLYKELVEMCQNYNCDTKFVLYISLCVVSETPASGAIKWERQLVSRCAKLRLSKNLDFIGPERETVDPPETLILTCPPIHLPTRETSMRARLIAFNNLEGQLRDRGVSLQRQYPELYKLLDIYCEDLNVKFEAHTIYPRNLMTNKSFMCIIMLESDPETLKHVEKAGVRVRTVDCLLSCETTANL